MKPGMISIWVGSESDLPLLSAANVLPLLYELGVSYEVNVGSIHRHPQRVHAAVIESTADVFIAAASMSAQLSGGIKAALLSVGKQSPVIAVPLSSDGYPDGWDATMASVRTPPGTNLHTAGVNAWLNAILNGVEMLAIANPDLRNRLASWRDANQKPFIVRLFASDRGPTEVPRITDEAQLDPRMPSGESMRRHLLDRTGLSLVHVGKVRDTFRDDEDAGKRLVMASNRISAFDFVLPAIIPRKGEVLTALTHFWLTTVLRDLPHHLLPQEELFRFLEAHWINSFVARYCLLVKSLTILPAELIFRAHLGGSVWAQYEKDQTVAGVQLPPGLQKWAKLEDDPIFTPSTKADKGHDVNITQALFREAHGDAGQAAMALWATAYARAYAYAQRECGILILDTKGEAGLDASGIMCIGDEVITPDSSRFTVADELARAVAAGKDPEFHDKEPVRRYLSTLRTPFVDRNGKPITGLKALDPENADHRNWVNQAVRLPAGIVEDTSARYLSIAARLLQKPLDDYQRDDMGIAAQ